MLIVHPRICIMRYGNVECEPEDVPWLRRLVSSTLEGIAKSQKENLVKVIPSEIA